MSPQRRRGGNWRGAAGPPTARSLPLLLPLLALLLAALLAPRAAAQMPYGMRFGATAGDEAVRATALDNAGNIYVVG